MSLSRTPRWIIAGLALVALVAGALPARAGETSWNDPKDDAKDFYVLTSTPLPNNDALDVVKSTIATQGADLSWVVKTKDMPDAGSPAHSTGFFFRLGFTYGGKAFEFRAGEDQVTGPTFSLSTAETPATAVTCEKCTGVVDRKKDSVVLTVPVAALAAGLKKALPDLPPLGPGAEFSKLYITAQRYIGGRLTMSADSAASPEGTVFAV